MPAEPVAEYRSERCPRGEASSRSMSIGNGWNLAPLARTAASNGAWVAIATSCPSARSRAASPV